MLHKYHRAVLISYFIVFSLYFFNISIVELYSIVYNITMEYLNSNYIETFVNLQGLLSEQVNEQCNTDFLSFVRLMAPSIVSGFEMGRHIEVISEKLQQIENGEIKRLMVFLPPRSSKSVFVPSYFRHGT